MIAFLPSLGFQEMFVLLVIGLLLYGRNLPEAGRSMGQMAAKLRRGFQDFKDQLDRDGDLRDVKKSLQDTVHEMRRATDLPRSIADPTRVMRDLTNEALSSPLPDEPPPTGSPVATAGTDAHTPAKEPPTP